MPQRRPIEELLSGAPKLLRKVLSAAEREQLDKLLDGGVRREDVIKWLREDPACAWVKEGHLETYRRWRSAGRYS